MQAATLSQPYTGRLQRGLLVCAVALAVLCCGCSDAYVGVERGHGLPRDAGSDASPAAPDAGDASRPALRPIRGAMYMPASAYNVDQMWLEYDPSITERDLGYAQVIHLNALRVFGSYYAYQQDAAKYAEQVDDLLTRASEKGMRVVFALFEGSGEASPSPEARALKDPLRASAIQSPPAEITSDPSRWQAPRDHVGWFMDRFRDDARLLAIELINEPGPDAAAFAHEMIRVAVANKGQIPITVGTTADDMLEYASDGIDVLQFQLPFPRSQAEARATIESQLAQARARKLPAWVASWQRVRGDGPNWSGEYAVPAAQRYPDLSSLATQVTSYESELGSFFWGLMVKPGYQQGQRNAGTVNGLFWPDGSVWDVAAARMLADDDGLALTERRRVPFEILRFSQAGTGSHLRCAGLADGTGQGHDVSASSLDETGNEARWQLVRIDGEAYFRLESMACQQWLECTMTVDATHGRPDATEDADALAVRAVEKTSTGDETRWRWLASGDAELSFFLQNKATGYYLEVTTLPNVDDGAGGAFQVRAVPATHSGPTTRFHSSDASN